MFRRTIWFDETQAVTSLGNEHGPARGPPELWPFGV
jgi:hypothetical protein